MKEKYIVYVAHTSNKLYETNNFIHACEFVEIMEQNSKDSDYCEKYEIVKVVA